MKLNKYNLVKSVEDLKELDTYLTQGNFSKLAVDTETNGLGHWKHVVIGVSISADNASGFYIPLLTWVPNLNTAKPHKKLGEIYLEGSFKCLWTDVSYPEDVTQLEYQPPEIITRYLKKWLLDSDVDLLMHNAPFDCLMIENNFGLDLSDKLACDTILLKHVLDENTSCGLKETAILWQKELGIPVDEEANKEQLEMGASIMRNGGTYNMRQKHIWRADLEVMYKYAIADTFLTYGIFEVGMRKFLAEYEEKHLKWFFQDEVMPLCREVVIPMKRKGITIDVEHFQALSTEANAKLDELESNIVTYLNDNKYLEGFTKGKAVDKVVTKKRLIQHIVKREELAYPTLKGKPSLSKKSVEMAYQIEPHWLWGYLLGENEIKYSTEELNAIKKEIYIETEGRNFQFNVGSDFHIRWLLFDKLGNDPKDHPQTESGTKEKPVPSVDADNLEQHFSGKYPFIKDLLLYKKLRKLNSTYISPAVMLNHNGVLYMDMKQHGTISGRFACGGGYNLQTLPKIEELDRCTKCNSKKVSILKEGQLLANVKCEECGHSETDILCPSVIKQGFVCPKGMKIINADYSSLEPRIFSFVSGDPKLKEIFTKGLDFYSKIYCDVEDAEGKYSPDPKASNFLKKVRNDLRTMVKPVTLGIPYGARNGQTANLMNYRISFEKDGKIREYPDVEKGKLFRDKFLNTYEKLKGYMINQEALTNSRGFVETLIGRRRHFKFAPEVFKLLSKSHIDYEAFLDESTRNLTKGEYKGFLNKEALSTLSKELGFSLFDSKKKRFRHWDFIRGVYKNEINNSKNFPIQGLGAHIANKAMLVINREFKRRNLNAWVCLQVHDEVTCYGDETKAKEISDIVREGMERNDYTKLVDIPILAEPLIADNLKDAK